MKNYDRVITYEESTSRYLTGKGKSCAKSRFQLDRVSKLKIDNENFGSMGHHSQRHLNLQHQKDRYKQSHKRTVRETMNGIAALLKGEEEDDAPENVLLGLDDKERNEEIGMEDIIEWRKLTLASAVGIQNSAKSFLPRVSVPKTKFKGLHAPDRLIKIPTGGKFGSDTMLYKPEDNGEDEKIEVTPPSYLEASLMNATNHTARLQKNKRSAMDHRKKTQTEKIEEMDNEIKESKEELALEIDVIERKEGMIAGVGHLFHENDDGIMRNKNEHDKYSNHHVGTRDTRVVYRGLKDHSGLS